MYDVIFLGGGPAGYEGAVAAAKNGLKTAVVEAESLGGTCLHWGCIPTKTLLHSVKLIKQLRGGAKLGIKADNIDLDLAALKKQKDRVVSKLTKGIELLFKNNGIDVFFGRGKIVSDHKIFVDGHGEVEARHIVISTGSKPAELPFLKFDGRWVINSDQAVTVEQVPGRLLVVGAGAIGLEMAAIYNYLGSQVTVVEIMDHILPGSDTELTDILKTELKKQKIKIHTSTRVANPVVDEEAGTITLDFRQEKKEWQETFNQVLLAVGRVPNSAGILGDSLSVEIDNRGFVVVDANLKTRVPHIFACGDVVGPPLLAHKASHQAIAIVDYITEGKAVNHYPVPGAVFTFPEFASVGLTEAEAREQYDDIKVGRFPFSAGSRSTAVDEKVGLVKVVATGDNMLLGAHIVGAEAGELMPLLTYGVMHELKADDFKEMVMIHPTLSENTWEAVAEIGGFSIHI